MILSFEFCCALSLTIANRKNTNSSAKDLETVFIVKHFAEGKGYENKGDDEQTGREFY